MLVEYKMLKSEKLIEDHAYTYISGNFIHFPHRVRLKECLEIIKKTIPEEVDNIVDFGGAAGFLGDFLSKYKVKIKYQKIYDVKHPLIKGVTTNFYKPDLKTNYYTFDMNIDDYNIDCINSNSTDLKGISIYCFCTKPIPCSPEIVPPRDTVSSKISLIASGSSFSH